MNDSNLNNLKIEELQIVLEHLKLGTKHLKKQLTPKQFKDLEDYGLVASHEKNEFIVDKTEKLSHLSIVLNSVISGIVGVWIGLARVLDVNISFKLAYIGGLSLLFGALMGIIILIRKKKESQEAISSLKLINVESQVYEFIYKKQKENLTQLIEKLKNKYEEICGKKTDKEPPSFEKKDDFASWFYLFQEAIHLKLNEFPKEEIFQYYRDKLLEILKSTENSFIEKGELVGNFGSSLKTETHGFSTKNDKYSALKILINPSLSIPKIPTHKVAWYKQKIFGFLFELFPTILGALGSILMWCNSFPHFAKIFNVKNAEDLLNYDCVPYIKISIAIFFTLNFLFFYCYLKRKMFQRKSNIELKEGKLLNQETNTVQMAQRLNLVFFLDGRIEEMIKILTFLNIFKSVIKNENMDRYMVMSKEKGASSASGACPFS